MNEYKNFDSLNDTFNVDGDIDDFNAPVEKPTAKKDKPKKQQKYSLESLTFIKTELQDRIECNRVVCEEMKNMLKQGAQPRMYEIYARLSQTISDDIMHLADVESKIADYQVVESKEEIRRKEFELKQQALMRKIDSKNNSNGSKVIMNSPNINNTYTITTTSKQLLEEVLAEDVKDDDEDVITNIEDLPKFNLD